MSFTPLLDFFKTNQSADFDLLVIGKKISQTSKLMDEGQLELSARS